MEIKKEQQSKQLQEDYLILKINSNIKLLYIVLQLFGNSLNLQQSLHMEITSLPWREC